MFDLKPEATPEGIPLSAVFETMGKVFAVDIYGCVYRIITDNLEPEAWCWEVMLYL